MKPVSPARCSLWQVTGSELLPSSGTSGNASGFVTLAPLLPQMLHAGKPGEGGMGLFWADVPTTPNAKRADKTSTNRPGSGAKRRQLMLRFRYCMIGGYPSFMSTTVADLIFVTHTTKIGPVNGWHPPTSHNFPVRSDPHWLRSIRFSS